MGYRYSQLDDGLEITEPTTSIDPASVVPVGTTLDLFDRFVTKNQFNGAELGISFHEQCYRWSLDVLMKLGLGNTHSRVVIDGTTTITVPQTSPITSAGGLLTQPTNIGRYDQNTFSMIPELGLTLGYDLTRQLRATFGYSLIYWSKVCASGRSNRHRVKPLPVQRRHTGRAPHPAFAFRTTDFWAEGLNFGLEWRF